MVNNLSKQVALPILRGLPETHFKVTDITIDRPAVRAYMAPGAPTRDERGGERPGAYGVLIDNVLGYSIIAGAPDHHWAVTTQMSIDFIGKLPQQPEAISAKAQLLDIDNSNGYSEGTLTNSTGRVFARMRQRARVISDFPPVSSTQHYGADEAVKTNKTKPQLQLDEILGLTTALNETANWFVEVTKSHVNPQGNLHGGVALCMAESVGHHALNQGTENNTSLYTSSIQVTYLRPVPCGMFLTLSAETVHRGRTMGVSRVVATLPNGKTGMIALVVAYAP